MLQGIIGNKANRFDSNIQIIQIKKEGKYKPKINIGIRTPIQIQTYRTCIAFKNNTKRKTELI